MLAIAEVTAHEGLSNPHSTYATDSDLTAHAATSHGAAHPDLATHDALGLATDSELSAHTGDTTDAHDASAISFSPVGTIAATDVQAAIAEVATEAGASIDWGETADITDEAFGDAADEGVLSEVARADHLHGMPVDPVTAHVAAGDPHTGYRLESADHSHASSGLQAGQIAYSALTGTPSAERAAASTTPAAVGTAAVGVGTTDARADHVHATGAGTPSTQAFGDSAATGSGPAAAMTDHKHAMPADPVTAHAAAGDPHTGYRLESADHSHASSGAQAGTIAHSDLTGLTSGDPHTQYATDSDLTTHAGTPHGGAVDYGETGDITDQDYDDVADAGVLDEAARADHLHGMPSAGGGAALSDDYPENITDTAFPGDDATASRDDHQHAYEFDDTAGPTAEAFADTASDGTAGWPARADHRHAMPANPTTLSNATPVAVDRDVAAAGSGTDVSRADHHHSITATGTPASTGITNSQPSTSVSVAQVNHVHAVGYDDSAGPAAEDYGDTADDGVSGWPARADHRHAMPAAADPAREFDYAQVTSSVPTTQTAEASATTVVTGNAVTYDGSTTIMVEFVTDSGVPQATSGANLIAYLYDGSSSIGLISRITNNAGATGRWPMYGSRRLTPSAGSHTYSIRITTSSGTGTILAGTGGVGTEAPAFMRITEVVGAGVSPNNIGAGTAFPGSPATSQRFFRTDLGLEFYYDGTRWLSTHLFTQILRNTTASGDHPFSATTGAMAQAGPVPSLQGGSDIWVVRHICEFHINGGTALSGSHKWVGTFRKNDSAGTETTVTTINITSGSVSVWRVIDTAIGALLGTTFFRWGSTWTKTGTPGNLTVHEEVTYRIVAT